MSSSSRRQEILTIITRRGYITVEELAEIMFVSLSTIRGDLTELEKEGSVRRSYGGVSIVDSQLALEPTQFRSRKSRTEKRYIARLASTLVSEGDSIFLDSGSTCLSLAQELADIPDLMILTNGLMTIHALSRYQHLTIDVPGGLYDITHACIGGQEAADYASRRHAKLAFVSCSGMTGYGFSVVYDKDIAVKKVYGRNSEKTIMLMDSSKFGIDKYYKVYDYSDIDVLVCDKNPPEDILEMCDKHGVEVIYE